MLSLTIALASMASHPQAADMQRPSEEVQTIRVDGQSRKYMVYAPQGLQLPARTLVLNHGGGGTIEGQIAGPGLKAGADRHGFVLVLPQGLNNTWNSSEKGKDFHAAYRGGRSDANDVAFLEALIRDQVAKGVAKEGQVFMAGISRGGLMTSRFACERAPLLAGIGLMIGLHHKENVKMPSQGLPVFLWHGTADPLMPFAGEVKKVPFTSRTVGVRSVDEIVGIWRKLNGSTQPAKMTKIDKNPKDKTSLEVRVYSDGLQPIYQIIVQGGGHVLGNVDNFLVGKPLGVVGIQSKEISTYDELFRFFKDSAR